ncbi:MAG: pilus assembly protein [Actinomycetes bacterium]
MASSAAGLQKDDTGSAVVEFVWLGLLLLVPLIYLVLCVMRVQAAAFAVTEAARAAGRAYAQADSTSVGLTRARAAAGIAVADQGFTLTTGSLRITCRLGACLTPGSIVDVRVQLNVALPLVPRVLAGASATTIPISALHSERIDVYRRWP